MNAPSPETPEIPATETASVPGRDAEGARTCPNCGSKRAAHTGASACPTRAASYEGKPGAWLIYDYDHGPYAISLHPSAETAAREAARQGYGKVGFWPFGEALSDAVAMWESQAPTTQTTPTAHAAPTAPTKDQQ